MLECVRRHAEPAAAREGAAGGAGTAGGGGRAAGGGEGGGGVPADGGDGGDDDEELKFSDEVDGDAALMPREAGGGAAEEREAVARPTLPAVGATPGELAAGGARDATAFAQYVALLPRLRLLRHLLWDGLRLQADVQAALQTAPPRELPLLHRSCVRHMHAATDADDADLADAGIDAGADEDADLASPRRLWTSLEPCIFAALKTIHASVLGWLATPPTHGAADGALLGALQAARLAHRAVWDFCAVADAAAAAPTAAAVPSGGGAGDWAAVGLEPQGFLVLWRALHKRLAKIAALPAALAAPAGLQAACARVGRAAGFSDAPLSTVLWRRGGPPVAPRSAELLGADVALRALAAPLEVLPESGGGAVLLTSQPTHPALWADAAQRRALRPYP